MMTFKSKMLVFCVTTAATINTAQAEEGDKKLDLTLGITGGVIPEYSGANGTETIFFPLVIGKYQINEQHAMLFNPYDGLSYAYQQTEELSYGVNVDFRGGRDSSDDPSLAGMPDIDNTLEVGPWIKYKNGQLTYMAKLGIDALDEYSGFTAELGVKYNIPINDQWIADIGGSVLYGNDNYAMTYYGVNASQVTGFRGLHEPGSGFQEAVISASLTHFIDENTFIRGDIGYKRLIGDAQNSPITERDNQFQGFLSVGYKF
jgi:outer membrane scaffolding protein for murein synthesis (MipA/OmpV family)